jgi:hypothetical protein
MISALAEGLRQGGRGRHHVGDRVGDDALLQVDGDQDDRPVQARHEHGHRRVGQGHPPVAVGLGRRGP